MEDNKDCMNLERLRSRTSERSHGIGVNIIIIVA
jgi:hypothetical protein